MAKIAACQEIEAGLRSLCQEYKKLPMSIKDATEHAILKVSKYRDDALRMNLNGIATDSLSALTFPVAELLYIAQLSINLNLSKVIVVTVSIVQKMIPSNLLKSYPEPDVILLLGFLLEAQKSADEHTLLKILQTAFMIFAPGSNFLLSDDTAVDMLMQLFATSYNKYKCISIHNTALAGLRQLTRHLIDAFYANCQSILQNETNLETIEVTLEQKASRISSQIFQRTQKSQSEAIEQVKNMTDLPPVGRKVLLLLMDLCNLCEHYQAKETNFSDISLYYKCYFDEGLCLDLLYFCIDSSPKLFLMIDSLFSIVKQSIILNLMDYLYTTSEYRIVRKCLMLLKLLTTHYFNLLRLELCVFFPIILSFAEEDGSMWQRILVLEFLCGSSRNPFLLLYLQYENKFSFDELSSYNLNAVDDSLPNTLSDVSPSGISIPPWANEWLRQASDITDQNQNESKIYGNLLLRLACCFCNFITLCNSNGEPYIVHIKAAYVNSVDGFPSVVCGPHQGVNYLLSPPVAVENAESNNVPDDPLIAIGLSVMGVFALSSSLCSLVLKAFPHCYKVKEGNIKLQNPAILSLSDDNAECSQTEFLVCDCNDGDLILSTCQISELPMTLEQSKCRGCVENLAEPLIESLRFLLLNTKDTKLFCQVLKCHQTMIFLCGVVGLDEGVSSLMQTLARVAFPFTIDGCRCLSRPYVNSNTHQGILMDVNYIPYHNRRHSNTKITPLPSISTDTEIHVQHLRSIRLLCLQSRLCLKCIMTMSRNLGNVFDVSTWTLVIQILDQISSILSSECPCELVEGILDLNPTFLAHSVRFALSNESRFSTAAFVAEFTILTILTSQVFDFTIMLNDKSLLSLVAALCNYSDCILTQEPCGTGMTNLPLDKIKSVLFNLFRFIEAPKNEENTTHVNVTKVMASKALLFTQETQKTTGDVALFPLYRLVEITIKNLSKFDLIHEPVLSNLLRSSCHSPSITERIQAAVSLCHIATEGISYFSKNAMSQACLISPIFKLVQSCYPEIRLQALEGTLSILQKAGQNLLPNSWSFIIAIIGMSASCEFPNVMRDVTNVSDGTYLTQQYRNNFHIHVSDAQSAQSVPRSHLSDIALFDSVSVTDTCFDEKSICTSAGTSFQVAKKAVNVNQLKTLFQIIELVTEDFVDCIPLTQCWKIIISAISLFGCYGHLGDNTSFRAVGFLWAVLEALGRISDHKSNKSPNEFTNKTQSVPMPSKFCEDSDKSSKQKLPDDVLSLCSDDIDTPCYILGVQLLKTSDHCLVCSPVDPDELWIHGFLNLRRLSVDDRPSVRNCAFKSLTSALITYGKSFGITCWRRCVMEILVTTMADVQAGYSNALRISETKNVKSQTSTAILVHHSRDSVIKQWDETLVVVMEGVLDFLIRYEKLVGMSNLKLSSLGLVKLLSSVLTTKKSSTEVLVAAVTCLSSLMQLPGIRTLEVSDDENIEVKTSSKCETLWDKGWELYWKMAKYYIRNVDIPEKLLVVFLKSMNDILTVCYKFMRNSDMLIAFYLNIILLTSPVQYFLHAQPLIPKSTLRDAESSSNTVYSFSMKFKDMSNDFYLASYGPDEACCNFLGQCFASCRIQNDLLPECIDTCDSSEFIQNQENEHVTNDDKLGQLDENNFLELRNSANFIVKTVWNQTIRSVASSETFLDYSNQPALPFRQVYCDESKLLQRSDFDKEGIMGALSVTSIPFFESFLKQSVNVKNFNTLSTEQNSQAILTSNNCDECEKEPNQNDGSTLSESATSHKIQINNESQEMNMYPVQWTHYCNTRLLDCHALSMFTLEHFNAVKCPSIFPIVIEMICKIFLNSNHVYCDTSRVANACRAIKLLHSYFRTSVRDLRCADTKESSTVGDSDEQNYDTDEDVYSADSESFDEDQFSDANFDPRNTYSSTSYKSSIQSTIIGLVPFVLHCLVLLRKGRDDDHFEAVGLWKIAIEGALRIIAETHVMASDSRFISPVMQHRYWLSVFISLNHFCADYHHVEESWGSTRKLVNDTDIMDWIILGFLREMYCNSTDLCPIYIAPYLTNILVQYSKSKSRPCLAAFALDWLFEICGDKEVSQPALVPLLKRTTRIPAALALLDQCSNILNQYMSDEIANGNFPLPRFRPYFVVRIIQKCRTISLDESILCQLPIPKAAQKVAGFQSHILTLFPALSRCITSRDRAIREEIRTTFIVLCEAMGLASTNFVF